MSAIDDFLATQPAAPAGNAPQDVSALISRDATSAAVPPSLRAPKVQAAQADQPGALASFGAGLGHGVQSTVLGAQQLLGRGLTSMGSDTVGPWLTQDAEKGIARGNADYAPYSAAHPIAAGAGNIGGNVAATAPLAMLAPEVAGMGLMGRAATGAALGAANGAVAPVENPGDNFWQQKGAQIGTNALVGGAAVPVTSALGGIIQGVADPVRRRLADAGVTMTPGQILGGAWQNTENKLTSVPVLGDMIRNAQQRSVQSFNRATYQNALEPIGGQLPGNVGAGSGGVAYVRNQIGNVYNSIEPRASFTFDQNFVNDLNGIRNTLGQMAPGSLPQFDNIVQNQIAGKLAGGAQNGIGGTMTGAQWGDTRSMISRIARNQIRGDASADQLALHDALSDLGDAVNAGVGRSSPPDVLPTLNQANSSYARYKMLERASASKGAADNGNVFTASQYSNGVRNNATAFQKATNSGLNGQMAADATNVLGSKYPDSGTVGRSLLTLGLGALAGHAAAPGAVIPGAIGIGAASLPYTALGQRLAQGLLMNRPALAQPVGNAITNGLAPLAPGLFSAFAR
jgi:hypothetical protein